MPFIRLRLDIFKRLALSRRRMAGFMHVVGVHDDIRLILSQSRLKGEKNRRKWAPRKG